MPTTDRVAVGAPIYAVAAATGLTSHTLRYYEDLGLITDVERSPSGHRSYSPADVKWVEFLLRLRETGMPVEEMRRFAQLRRDGPPTAVDRQQMLNAHRRRVRAEQARLADNLAAIDEKIAYYEDLVATETTDHMENVT